MGEFIRYKINKYDIKIIRSNSHKSKLCDDNSDTKVFFDFLTHRFHTFCLNLWKWASIERIISGQ